MMMKMKNDEKMNKKMKNQKKCINAQKNEVEIS